MRQLAQQINPVSDGFYVREFLECKQKPGETVPDFAYKLKTLHNKAFPNADNIELRLARLKDHFVNGLEIDLRFKFQDKKGANQGENVKTFDALVTEAHQYDINRKAKKDERARVDYINSITQPSEIKVLCDAIQSLTTSLANIKEQQKQTIAKVEQISINKGRNNSNSYNSFNQNGYKNARNSNIICNFCGKRGHIASACFQKKQDELKRNNICSKCNKKGHFPADCWSGRRRFNNNNFSNRTSSRSGGQEN